MKTAISIPDPVFRKAEKLAKKMKKSRSQYYAEAVAEYNDRHDDDEMVSAINDAYEEEDAEFDGFVREAGQRLLENSEW